MKGLALGTALSLGTFGFTAIGTGAAFSSPTVNTAAASQNTTKVIKLANGKTRVRVDLADNLRGKTVTIRTSRIVNGERVLVTLGTIKLTKTGKGYLTVSRKIRVDDRIIVRDSGTSIVNSKVLVIDDRTPAVVAPLPTPAPPASGGSDSSSTVAKVTASTAQTGQGVIAVSAVTAVAEVQTLTVTGTLAASDEFSLAIGEITLNSGALTGTPTLTDLASALSAHANKDAAGINTITADVSAGTIIITYHMGSNDVDNATLLQTTGTGVTGVTGETLKGVAIRIVTAWTAQTEQGVLGVSAVTAVAEIQTITVTGTLAANDEFSLAAGGETLTSGALTGTPTLTDLAAALSGHADKAAAGIDTITADVSTGTLIITYLETAGDVANAVMTQTKVAGASL